MAVGAGQRAARAGHRRARRRGVRGGGRRPGARRAPRRPWPRRRRPRSRCWRAGAAPAAAPQAAPGQVKVVATTTQIGDFARAVGGERAKVVQVLQPNTDPHDYEPRPSDVRETADADVVLLNGDELDRWMGDVVEAGGRRPGDRRPRRARARSKVAGESQGPEASRYDPHWWHDPRNAAGGRGGDPRRADARPTRGARDVYARNAAAYLAPAASLDRGIAACMSRVAAGRAQARHRPRRLRLLRPALRHHGRRRRHPLAEHAGPAVGGRRRAADAAHPARGRQGGLPGELDQRQARPGDRAPDRRDERPRRSTATRSGPRGRAAPPT